MKFTGDGKLDPQIRVSDRSVIEECPPDLGVGQVDDARMTPKFDFRAVGKVKMTPRFDARGGRKGKTDPQIRCPGCWIASLRSQ